MGKLSEIFKNRNLIWEGLKNNVFKQEHIEEIYHERLEICKTCILFDLTGDGCTIPRTQPCCNSKLQTTDAKDGTMKEGCGCSLTLKLRSLSSKCPAHKWLALTSEQEEQMIIKIIEDKKQ